MLKKAYFLVGSPESKHWSTLTSAETVKGRYWLAVAVSGDEALSVGKELSQVIKETKLATEEDLYHLTLQLQNIALDNQVRLSIVGAFLSLKQWTFFSLRALVGLKRQGKPIRFLIDQADNKPQVLTGNQKFGDLVFGVFGELTSEKTILSQLINKLGYKDKLLTWIKELVDQKKLPLSAGVMVLDVDKLLQPPKFYQLETKQASAPSVMDQISTPQTLPKVTLTKSSKPKPSLTKALKCSGEKLKPFLILMSLKLTHVLAFLKAETKNLYVFGQEKLKNLNERRKVAKLKSEEASTTEAVNLDDLLEDEPEEKEALPRKLELTQKPKKKKLPKINFKNKRLVGLVVFVLLVATVLGLALAFKLSLNKRHQVVSKALVPYTQKLELLKTKDESYLPKTRDEAKEILNQLQKLKSQYKPNSLEAKEIDKQIQATEAFLTSIAGKKEFQALPTYLDVSQFAADFVTSNAFFANNKLWLLDKAKKALIIYDPVLAQTHQQALISLDEVKDMSAYKDKALLLDNGVYTLAADPTASPESLIPQDEVISGASLINSFGDYVYVYNPEKANIYRYGSDFKEKPKTWLKTILGGKYNQVVSWAIDGNIWLSTRDSLVNRYQSGKRTQFEIKGLDEPLSGPVYLTTTEDLDKLYLLVPDQDRVVQLDKNGNFISQVKNFVLGSAIGLTYNDTDHQLLAVSGSVVYVVPF